MRSLVLWLLIFTLSAGTSAAMDSSLLKKLAAHSPLGSVALSYDGSYVAGIIGKEEGQFLAVWEPLKGFEPDNLTEVIRPDIKWMTWVGDGRLLIGHKDNSVRIFLAGKRTLTVLEKFVPPKTGTVAVVSTVPSDKDYVLLQWAPRGGAVYPAVYKVNLETGLSEQVIAPRNPIISWWATDSGHVWLGSGYRGRKQLVFKASNLEEIGEASSLAWRQIKERDYFNDPIFQVLGLESNSKTAIILSSHEGDRSSIWRYDLLTEKFVTRLASHSRFDMESAFFDPREGNFAGGAYIAAGQEQYFLGSDWKNYEPAET